MKLVPLTNESAKRISIMQVGLRLNPGQTKRVHPSVLDHPAVSPYLGKGLKATRTENVETKAEPIAPDVPPVIPPSTSDETETLDETENSDETENEDDDTETAGETLRTAYVEAPGVTDANVDAVMGAFPTFQELAAASKDDLVEVGVAKSYAKKLLDYAAQQ